MRERLRLSPSLDRISRKCQSIKLWTTEQTQNKSSERRHMIVEQSSVVLVLFLAAITTITVRPGGKRRDHPVTQRQKGNKPSFGALKTATVGVLLVRSKRVINVPKK